MNKYKVVNMSQLDIKVGSKLKFSNDRLWFAVMAISDKFAVCDSKGAKYHTIVDFNKKIRGDDNLVFHNGYDTKELCEARLSELESGDLEISHRNNVPLEIIAIK